MSRKHTRAAKLAAVVLARHSTLDEAASTFGIAKRSLARWMATLDVPDDEWEAIEQTLLARASEMTARGEVRGLVQTLTGAGIASRNARNRELIARREARREAEQQPPEPEDPERLRFEQVRDRLDPVGGGRRLALATIILDVELASDQLEPSRAPSTDLALPGGRETAHGSPPYWAAGADWLESLEALPDDEAQAQLEQLGVELLALQARIDAQRTPPPDQAPAEAAEPEPEPPAAEPIAIDKYREDHDLGWHRVSR
jgi:hypothetical protein